MILPLKKGIGFILLAIFMASCSSKAAKTPRIAENLQAVEPVPTTMPQPTVASSAVPAPTLSQTTVPTPDTVPEQLFSLVSQEPIISAGDGGEWFRRLHNPGAIVYHDGRFHMFRNGYQTLPGNTVIGYASSPDGINWTHYEENPVFETDDVPYAELMIMASSAMVQDDGTWVLYFLIWDTPNNPGAIGRATAPSPIGPWTPDDAPVLQKGNPETWDSEQVTQPTVLADETGSGYVMYYTGVDQKNVSRIGLAFSLDGISWSKYDDPSTSGPLYAESDPVLQPGISGDWDSRGAERGRVVRSSEGLVMIFRTPGPGSGFTYGLAVSADGINWDKYEANPISRTGRFARCYRIVFPHLYLRRGYLLFLH